VPGPRSELRPPATREQAGEKQATQRRSPAHSPKASPYTRQSPHKASLDPCHEGRLRRPGARARHGGVVGRGPPDPLAAKPDPLPR